MKRKIFVFKEQSLVFLFIMYVHNLIPCSYRLLSNVTKSLNNVKVKKCQVSNIFGRIRIKFITFWLNNDLSIILDTLSVRGRHVSILDTLSIRGRHVSFSELTYWIYFTGTFPMQTHNDKHFCLFGSYWNVLFSVLKVVSLLCVI